MEWEENNRMIHGRRIQLDERGEQQYKHTRLLTFPSFFCFSLLDMFAMVLKVLSG